MLNTCGSSSGIHSFPITVSRILNGFNCCADHSLLLAIPGVGQTTAAVVIAELGEIDRFEGDKQVVSYAGLDPVVHQAGDTEIHGSISKEGPGALRWALVQSARIAVRCSEYFGNFYTRLERRKNDKIAIVATARKLLVSIFHMLKRNEPYDPPEVSA